MNMASKEQDKNLLINKASLDNEPNIENHIANWVEFEREILDWSRKLTQEQKYTPYPAQFLEWLKKNYKVPQKK